MAFGSGVNRSRITLPISCCGSADRSKTRNAASNSVTVPYPARYTTHETIVPLSNGPTVSPSVIAGCPARALPVNPVTHRQLDHAPPHDVLSAEGDDVVGAPLGRIKSYLAALLVKTSTLIH